MSAAAPAPAAAILIRPTRGWVSLRLRELWAHRELLFFLAWRDVKVRYKQTVFGAAWAILQPLAAMLVFTIFFGRLARIGSDGLPYPVFSYAGLLPWIFFAKGVSESAESLVGSANLIRKVYFPRLLIPCANVLAGLLDFALAFAVLAAMMIRYGIHPGSAIVFLPAFLLLAVVSALGVGTWLSAFNVQYRDVRYVVPFLIQLWLFVTPVIYPMGPVTQRLEELGLPAWIYGINPMAGVVTGFRWALLSTPPPAWPIFAASFVSAAALLLSGAFYFRRVERSFADVV